MPVPVSTYLLNEKRDAIKEIEERNNTMALLVPDTNLETPHYEIERIRASETEHESHNLKSHELANKPAASYTPAKDKAEVRETAETAAVQGVMPVSPIPAASTQNAATSQDTAAAGTGFIAWLTGLLSGKKVNEEEPRKKPAQAQRNNRGRGGQRNSNQRARGRRDQGQNKRAPQNLSLIHI